MKLGLNTIPWTATPFLHFLIPRHRKYNMAAVVTSEEEKKYFYSAESVGVVPMRCSFAFSFIRFL
jgi:hypothetical protein